MDPRQNTLSNLHCSTLLYCTLLYSALLYDATMLYSPLHCSSLLSSTMISSLPLCLPVHEDVVYVVSAELLALILAEWGLSEPELSL